MLRENRMSLIMDLPSCRYLSIIQVAVLSRPLVYHRYETQRRQILEHHLHIAVIEIQKGEEQ